MEWRMIINVDQLKKKAQEKYIRDLESCLSTSNVAEALADKIYAINKTLPDVLGHLFFSPGSLDKLPDVDQFLFQEMIVCALSMQSLSIYGAALDYPMAELLGLKAIRQVEKTRYKKNFEFILSEIRNPNTARRREGLSEMSVQAFSNIIRPFDQGKVGLMHPRFDHLFKEIYPQDEFHKNLYTLMEEIFRENAILRWREMQADRSNLPAANLTP